MFTPRPRRANTMPPRHIRRYTVTIAGPGPVNADDLRQAIPAHWGEAFVTERSAR